MQLLIMVTMTLTKFPVILLILHALAFLCCRPTEYVIEPISTRK